MKFTFVHSSGQEETISAPHLGLAWKKLRTKSEHGKDKSGWTVKSDKKECTTKAKGQTNWYVPKGLTPERIGLAGPPRVKRLKRLPAESIPLASSLLEGLPPAPDKIIVGETVVGFDCDVEQYSVVSAVRNIAGNWEVQVTVRHGGHHNPGEKIWKPLNHCWT